MKRLLAAAALLAACIAPLASAAPLPRLQPDPFFSAAGALSEPLGVEAFGEVALVASGLAPAATLASDSAVPDFPLAAPPSARDKAVRAKLAALVARAKELPSTSPSAYSRGEAVLSLLYESALKRYSEFQTDLGAALGDGSYNCVSSAVLYMGLAKAAGLAVKGVETKDHAFCAVMTERGWVDVETTNKYGFDPGTKKEFRDLFGRATGYSYVASGDYANRRDIGERGLISLILSNRSTMAEAKKDYAAAVGIAVDRHALLAGAEEPRYLLDRLLNFAGDLHNRGKYADALAFLDAALADEAADPQVAAVFDAVVAALAAKLGSEGDDEGAVALLRDRFARGMVSRANYDLLLSQSLVDRWARSFGSAPFADAVAAIDASIAAGEISAADGQRLLVFYYGRNAQAIAEAGDYLAAADSLLPGIARYPAEKSLAKARATYRDDYAIDVHNRFAALYAAKKYAEGLALLEEGLAKVPESALLSRDIDIAKKALKP